MTGSRLVRGDRRRSNASPTTTEAMRNTTTRQPARRRASSAFQNGCVIVTITLSFGEHLPVGPYSCPIPATAAPIELFDACAYGSGHWPTVESRPSPPRCLRRPASTTGLRRFRHRALARARPPLPVEQRWICSTVPVDQRDLATPLTRV